MRFSTPSRLAVSALAAALALGSCGGETPSGGPATESTDTTMSSADKIGAVDSNGDGILSSAEHAQGSQAMFARMDADRNGSLGRAEYDAGHKAIMGGGGTP